MPEVLAFTGRTGRPLATWPSTGAPEDRRVASLPDRACRDRCRARADDPRWDA